MGLIPIARRVVLVLCVVGSSFIGFYGTAAAAPASPPAAEATIGGNDYPWPTADMDRMSPLRFAYRNCTDYVAFKLNQQLGGSLSDVKFDWSTINYQGDGNARAWRQGAAGKYMVDDKPGLGSVAWWGNAAGGYGHTALVVAVAADGNSVQLNEYNRTLDGRFQEQPRTVQRGQAGWPEAFIHVADRYAEGTVLKTDQARAYVVAGGAALRLQSTDRLPAGAPVIDVMQRQVDTMPQQPRDGTPLRDPVTNTDYTYRQGGFRPLADPAAMHGAWGQNLGDWAAGYVTPGLIGGKTVASWPAPSARSTAPGAPAPLKLDITLFDGVLRPLSAPAALQ